ncbi:HAMP domain-containing protein [Heliobacterium gestii]|uniref:histidine kinase n=1 Tax=Heliomicrobium gestii TaxID=2699 RepID=A0A845LDN7_HELGE|nr:ATP-binding protein [Heliomicrobium gestii]MBM7865406.1 two-component system sensor histidine kinase BaeS [Heliomicrobium gestii]MZP41663.1 HAMP domain-containing protein [Heliomicrobium gestii]
MQLRSKLFLGALLIVLSLSGVYFTLSLTATNAIFNRYDNLVQRQVADEILNSLAEYYISHGESWNGVEEYMLPMLSQRPQRDKRMARTTMALFDEQNNPIAAWPRGAGDSWRNIDFENKGNLIPIIVEERQVGRLWMMSRSPTDGIRDRVSSSLLDTFLISIVASTVIAVMVTYLLARYLTKPLLQMAGATREIKKRRFDLRLPVQSQDEVGAVIQAFNEMSEALQRGEQIRTNLVADVAHELRTPLTIIQGQLESIQQGVLPASIETILPIQDEVIRLNRLVDDLRQLTLAEAGKLPLCLCPTDVTALLRRIVEIFSVESELRKVELRLTVPEAPCWITADPDRLTQIVVNILSNALHHSPDGGTVHIGLQNGSLQKWADGNAAMVRIDALPAQGREPLAEGMVIWMADEGPGIAPEQLPYIFDRFFRCDASRDRESGGSGLGLAIAREYVLAHGGAITAVNQQEKGSCFAFFMPEKPPAAMESSP